MASSDLKELVNIVLRTTGDLAELTAAQTVAGAAGGIGKRITDFLNLTVTDLEKRTNWPALRLNVAGTTNGTDNTYEFVGTNDLRVGGNISVWVEGVGRLEELTPEQFDRFVAEEDTVGVPTHYQRGVSPSGVLELQIYPLPTAGYTLHASGYQKATRFDSAVDTGTTEFDDALLVYGALMHMDLFDGMQRGYDSLFKNQIDTTMMELFGNRRYHVEVEGYR